MAIEVIMPQMGESIAEGTLVRWLKKIGENVDRDEPLFEISTDKVDTEIPSPADGVLKEIRVEEGETVAVQTVVALLDSKGGSVQETKSESASRAIESTPKEFTPASVTSTPDSETAKTSAKQTIAESTLKEAKETLDSRLQRRSSPLVRRIAREHGINLNEVGGTGANDRVTKNDIMAYIGDKRTATTSTISLEAPSPSPASQIQAPPLALSPEDIDVKPLSKMRQKIAEHMVMSKHTSPHVTTVFEVDMTEVANLVTKNKESFLQSNGVKLTFMPFIMKATIGALREYPVLNASLRENKIHYFKKINLGIAVALDDGLIVPVVKDAEDKSLVGLSRSVRDLATRSRSKKLQTDEVQGGTFTISNHGVFGSLFATPVINQPQSGILGVGTITKRPVVLPGTDAIAIRSMMYIALSFDHRLIDGAIADKFMVHIKEVLESCPFTIETRYH